MRVLIAEDDPIARRILEAMLKKWDYDVITVSDGDAAWAELQRPDAPKLAVLDWQMPGMDGVDIIRKLREIGGQEYFYTILLTSRDTKQDLVIGMQAGADDYIAKPFDPQELSVRLRAATRIIQQQAELAEARNQEMRIAGRVQKTLLFGKTTQSVDWLDYAVLATPAREVGGDFYDVFKHGDTCIDFVLGDVMGKGVPAALLGAGAKSRVLYAINSLLTESSTHALPSPHDIVDFVNVEITPELMQLDSFVTACYTRFDRRKKQFLFVDCGHLPIIHVHASTGECSLLKTDNVPLGFLEDESYRQSAVPYEIGDLFCLYSDGVTEAHNGNGEMFEEERVIDVLRSAHTQSPREILDKLSAEVNGFCRSTSFDDDVTCIAAKIVDK